MVPSQAQVEYFPFPCVSPSSLVSFYLSGELPQGVGECVNVCVHGDKLVSYTGCIPVSCPVFPGKTPDPLWP